MGSAPRCTSRVPRYATTRSIGGQRSAARQARPGRSRRVTASVEEAIAQQRRPGVEGVGPADLLALVPTPPPIGDRHLDDAIAPAQHLGGDLRTDVEALGAQP